MSIRCMIIHATLFGHSLPSIFLHPRLNPKTFILCTYPAAKFRAKNGSVGGIVPKHYLAQPFWKKWRG